MITGLVAKKNGLTFWSPVLTNNLLLCVCDTRLSFLFLNQIITFYNIVETHQLHSISPPSGIITKTDIRNIDKKQMFVLCKYL